MDDNVIPIKDYYEILELLAELKEEYPEHLLDFEEIELEFLKLDAYLLYLNLETLFGKKEALLISAEVCKIVYKNVYGEEISRNSELQKSPKNSFWTSWW